MKPPVIHLGNAGKEPQVKCPKCGWEGTLPKDLWCPNGHDLTPWEPLAIYRKRVRENAT